MLLTAAAVGPVSKALEDVFKKIGIFIMASVNKFSVPATLGQELTNFI